MTTYFGSVAWSPPVATGAPPMRTSSADSSPAVVRGQQCLDRPVLARSESVDLALALDHETHGDRLDAAGRQPRVDLPPQQRRQGVADETIEDAPRLLGVHEVVVDVARMSERVADRVRRDLGEGHAARLVRRHFRGLGDVPRDRLALAIEVSREIDRIGRLRLLGDRGDLLASVLADYVFRFEIVFDVDAQLVLARVLGQVTDVPVRRQDPITGTQVSLDRARLGR